MESFLNIVQPNDVTPLSIGRLEIKEHATDTLLAHMHINTTSDEYAHLGLATAIFTLLVPLTEQLVKLIDTTQYKHIVLVAEDNAKEIATQQKTGWTSRRAKSLNFTNDIAQKNKHGGYGVSSPSVFILPIR